MERTLRAGDTPEDVREAANKTNEPENANPPNPIGPTAADRQPNVARLPPRSLHTPSAQDVSMAYEPGSDVLYGDCQNEVHIVDDGGALATNDMSVAATDSLKPAPVWLTHIPFSLNTLHRVLFGYAC
jgi:hypothetical protein